MHAVRHLLSLALGLSIAVTASACSLEDGPVGGGDGDVPTRIASDEPGVDDRLDALGIICESTLTVTGSVTAGAPQPADEFGCWAVGTWHVQAVIDFQGCDPQPQMMADYVYEITRDDESQTNIVYLEDPDNERQNLKITTSSDNLCHGSFEHFFEDGTTLVFQPTMQQDGTLQGAGAYSIYEESPF